jgi:prevent-host-death family protein
MTTTLSKSQAELPRLVEIASRGEDVVITVEGKPKARLTRAENVKENQTPIDMRAWLHDLEEARRKYTIGDGPTTQAALDEDRSDRI